jgi:hypothetical protein
VVSITVAAVISVVPWASTAELRSSPSIRVATVNKRILFMAIFLLPDPLWESGSFSHLIMPLY